MNQEIVDLLAMRCFLVADLKTYITNIWKVLKFEYLYLWIPVCNIVYNKQFYN
jgi:hypothetical protein